MCKYKYVLFDFNGTLLDDIDMNIEIEKLLLAKRNISGNTSKEFYLENFGFPIIDFYKLLGFDFSKEDYSQVAVEYAEEYERKLKTVSLFSDALPILKKLNESGINCVIISATEHETLKAQTEHFGLTKYFKAILGTNNNLGKSKIGAALDWFSACAIDPKDAVFIGDTIHDFETAKALGCDCVLIPRGHNSERRLRETSCFVFGNLEEFYEAFFQYKN